VNLQKIRQRLSAPLVANLTAVLGIIFTVILGVIAIAAQLYPAETKLWLEALISPLQEPITLLLENPLIVVAIGLTIWLVARRISPLQPKFKQIYYKHLAFEHQIFNVRGLRTLGTFKLELKDVFVALRIAPSYSPQQFNANMLSNQELTGSHQIWKFLEHGQKSKQRVWALVGAPGCGKTTLLQHIALTFAQQQQRQHHFSIHLIPIFLFLRQHIAEIVENRHSLAELLENYYSDKKRFDAFTPPPLWFTTQLKQGRCIVLLDGLDEVADEQHRRAVSAWVDRQVVNYQENYFLITSRPQGYRTAPLQSAHVLEIQPFTSKQVQQFVTQWYLANEITSSGGKNDEGVQCRAKQGAEDLLLRLKNTPSLNDLTVNPLLLTMVAMVHRYRGQLPGRREELYAEICDVLLGFWRESKELKDALTAKQKRAVLQPLAANMMVRGIREIETEAAMQVIRSPLTRIGLKGEAAEQFLPDIQASSGLFLEKEGVGGGTWHFAHLTFQEYLAACYFLEHKDKFKYDVTKTWWHETLRLYVAQADASDVVRMCLKSQQIEALALAVDCLEEARELDGEVREQVEELLTAGLESPDPERRKLAAEVRLKRRLR